MFVMILTDWLTLHKVLSDYQVKLDVWKTSDIIYCDFLIDLDSEV